MTTPIPLSEEELAQVRTLVPGLRLLLRLHLLSPTKIADDYERLLATIDQLARGEGRDAVVSECARCVPTNWLDGLLTGPAGLKGKFDEREIEKLLRGIRDRIHALKSPKPQDPT